MRANRQHVLGAVIAAAMIGVVAAAFWAGRRTAGQEQITITIPKGASIQDQRPTDSSGRPLPRIEPAHEARRRAMEKARQLIGEREKRHEPS